MNLLRPTIFALSFLAVACAEFENTPETETREQAIVGGDPVLGSMFPAVAQIKTTRPNDEQGMPRDPLDCSGVLVAPGLILTSAICVFDNVSDTGALVGTINIGFGGDGNSPLGGLAGTDVEIHRYFDENTTGTAQLAFVHFVGDVSAIAAPAVLNEAPFDTFSGNVTVVGYGKEGDTGIGGVRRGISLLVGQVGREFFSNGSAGMTSCEGDGGGPVFADLGAGDVLVGITQFQSVCRGPQNRTRIDVHTTDFLIPYIDQFSGNCPVDGTCTTDGCRTDDPDCAGNECLWGNDICEADCPTRDWDCPDGSFAGGTCMRDSDCEQNGLCLTAADDSEYLYCTLPCDSTFGGSQCPTNMTCDASNQCLFDTPSPGSQGFTCARGNDCRSGICEDTICVNTCDPAASTCPEEFPCGPSKVMPGTNVCLGVSRTGGGGFCQVGSSEGRFAGGLLLLLALGLVRRRQR